MHNEENEVASTPTVEGILTALRHEIHANPSAHKARIKLDANWEINPVLSESSPLTAEELLNIRAVCGDTPEKVVRRHRELLNLRAQRAPESGSEPPTRPRRPRTPKS